MNEHLEYDEDNDPDAQQFKAEEAELKRRLSTEPYNVPLVAHIQPVVMERLQHLLQNYPRYDLDHVVNKALHAILYDRGY